MNPFQAALFANIGGSLLGSLLLNIASGLFFDGFGRLLGSTLAIALYGFIISIPFVLLYGMPLYALLKKVGLASYLTAIVFGSIPGLLVIIFGSIEFLNPILFVGVSISVLYHYFNATYEYTPSNKAIKKDV